MKRLIHAHRFCVLVVAAAALIGASIGVSPVYATDCSSIPAAVTVVEPDYLVVTPTGVSPDDQDALQYAVDCVEPGGTVVAGVGEHFYGTADFVTIDNDLTLQGAGDTVFVGGRATITVDANHQDVELLDFTMRGPTLAGIQLLGGNDLVVMDIEITDIIPDLIQTVTGPFVIGSGIWAHESILTTSDNPRFHGSITISDCDIRDFAFPSSENAPILVNDFDQSTIPITIEDNSVGGTNVLFGIATVGLVTPTTWILGNDIDATDALGGLSVRVHPAGIPGEIHIEDNTVKGGFFGMLWFFAPAGGSTVRGNRIRDSFIGIALHGSNSHDFDDNRITDVVFGIRLGLQDVFPFPIPSVPSNGSTFSDILVSGTEWGLYVTEGATGNVFCDPGFKDVNVPIFEDAGTSSIFACVIPVDIDIKFCSNPNAHNCRSGGALPVTIFGAADLDVADIDLASLQLCRADGGGCTSTTSGDGVIDSSIYDRGTPGDRGFGTAECTIIEDPPGSGILEEVGNPDGFLDLDAAFDKSAVSALLDICDDSGSKGDSSVALFIQGSLLDGTQIISTPIGDDGIDQLVRKNR